MWKRMIKEKYNLPDIIQGPSNSSRVSNLWRNIQCLLEPGLGNVEKAIKEGLAFSVGAGNLTKFWEDLWLGGFTLKDKFPRLYSISSLTSQPIESFGFWDGIKWSWLIPWRRDLFQWEEDLENELLDVIGGLVIAPGRRDKIVWRHTIDGNYTVKSLTCASENCPDTSLLSVTTSKIWTGWTPPKVEFFVWLALQGRINTRGRLCSLGILPRSESSCPFCHQQEESVDHLLFLCEGPRMIWYKIINWWGVEWCCGNTLSNLFEQWQTFASGKKQRQVWSMMFNAAVWTIWIERNKVIFEENHIDWGNVLYLVYIRFGLWLKAVKINLPYSGPEIMHSSDGIKFRTNLIKPTRPPCEWSAPPTGCLKWNTDGSSLDYSSGVGGVLRDCNGNFLCIFSGPASNLDSNSAELRAIRFALEFSVKFGLKEKGNILVESDSLNVVNWLQKEIDSPWSKAQDFNAIANLSSQLSSITYNHVCREANSVADSLAKQGALRSDMFVACFTQSKRNKVIFEKENWLSFYNDFSG
ncbi:uncharacterized protein LOC119985586 [Tripterygium wilfordii]|uniref:uncharacterized protein LOC119985586 n=1 Tax=Tripterygium wilfordii TaxID=458696 RepID=UPI0018F8526A|nr:uncharacterized protein LOC119985586 [Tripterygium wilfordii]